MLLRRLAALAEGFARALQILSQLALVALLGLVAHEVFVRYALNAPTQFSVEISEYLLVFISFASAAWILRRDRHVRVRLLLDRLPERTRAVLEAAGMLLLAAFAAVLVWKGAEMALTAWQGDDRSSSLLSAPLWIPYSFIPLGGLALMLMALVLAARGIARARGTEG
ncbi:MAG: TRAP transporter small permease [Pseudomonadota bacterium]